MTWIKHPLTLIGETVDIIPLEKKHLEKLFQAATDKNLWEHIPLDCSNRKTFDEVYNFALSERIKKNQYPFVIIHKTTKEIIGSTRFFQIVPKDKKLEIGWTWIIQKYWGTDVNYECKLLLLTYCFETLQARRVQLKTDETNLRSRKAIERIGGHFEGILRKDKIKENGDSRNAAYYSITDDEWHIAKQKITGQLDNKRTENTPN